MTDQPKAPLKKAIGRLLIIGGAEDPDEDNLKILPHFVKMAGGSSAVILVCGTPSEDPKEKERKYGELFEKIGVSEVLDAGIRSRNDAENEEAVAKVNRATGVFFTGGDQLRLTALIAGTRFCDALEQRLWNEGLVIGGTSAGAAAMSSTMVTGGPNEGSVRRADVDLAPGLTLMREMTIDTHFSQRGRVNRLLAVFGQNPQVLCVGIDEDTAVEVDPGVAFKVIGNGAVTIFDGRVSYSNAPDVGDHDVMALTDSSVHVLPEGYGFDLRTKRPLLPDGREIRKPEPPPSC